MFDAVQWTCPSPREVDFWVDVVGEEEATDIAVWEAGRRMVRAAKAGATYKEIARATGLSPSAASQVIEAYLYASRAPSPVEAYFAGFARDLQAFRSRRVKAHERLRKVAGERRRASKQAADRAEAAKKAAAINGALAAQWQAEAVVAERDAAQIGTPLAVPSILFGESSPA